MDDIPKARVSAPYNIIVANKQKYTHHVFMKSNKEVKTNKEYLALYHEKKRSEGGRIVNVYVPANLVARLDQIKDALGVRSRAPVIEKALEAYLENINQRAK